MAKFLEPRYLVYAVVASMIAVVALQVTGATGALQADPPHERLETIYNSDRDRDRVPIAITPKESDDETRRR